MDGVFLPRKAIAEAADREVTVNAPVPASRSARDPHTPRADDYPAVVLWWARMATPKAKALYTKRAATAESVTAPWKGRRGLHRVRVRGRAKVLFLALWMAVTRDLLRWVFSAKAAA